MATAVLHSTKYLSKKYKQDTPSHNVVWHVSFHFDFSSGSSVALSQITEEHC